MCKKICFIFFCFMLLHTLINAQTPSAVNVLKPAYAKAAQTNKRVLLIFHASWCGWCKKMDASLADSAIKAAIDRNFQIVHLTVYENGTKKNLENSGGLELLKQLGGADKGLPYWFVLDAKGNKLANSEFELGKNAGCPSAEAEVVYFIKVLQQTGKFTPAELEAIKLRFKKNEG